MKIFILFTLLPFMCMSQNSGGISFSFSTHKAFSVDAYIEKKGNGFHLGYSRQFGGEKATTVKKREPNYGLTKIEDGNFFWLVDIGYSLRFIRRINLNLEVNLGQRNYFTSYEDDRFKDGAYSLITKSKSVAGIGLNIGYSINEILEVYTGYGTLKGVIFGLRIAFNKNR